MFLPNANVNKNGQKKQQDIVRCKPNEREWKKFFLELFIFIIHALIQSQVDLRGCKKLLSSVVLFFVVVYLIKFLVGKINNVENEKWSLFASTMAQMLIATLNNSERTRIYINYVNNLFVCKENKINQMMRWIIANARKKRGKLCEWVYDDGEVFRFGLKSFENHLLLYTNAIFTNDIKYIL